MLYTPAALSSTAGRLNDLPDGVVSVAATASAPLNERPPLACRATSCSVVSCPHASGSSSGDSPRSTQSVPVIGGQEAVTSLVASLQNEPFTCTRGGQD